MKRLWLLLAIAVPLQFIHAQVQHALTVEQCRADQKLVLSKLKSNERTLISYKEGDGWYLEMQDCISVDPCDSLRRSVHLRVVRTVAASNRTESSSPPV